MSITLNIVEGAGKPAGGANSVRRYRSGLDDGVSRAWGPCASTAHVDDARSFSRNLETLRSTFSGMYDVKTAQLDHERLDVYRCAIEFLQLALVILAKLPRGEAELRTQLRRAAMSIPLNIAEGTGKPAGAERIRFYGIARGSTMECSAILDVCALSGHLTPTQTTTGRELLVRLAAMLSKMTRP